MRKMGTKLLGALSWILISLSVFWGVVAVLMVFDEGEDKQGAMFGGIVLGVGFGLPGGILRWRLKRQAAEDKFWQELVGFVRLRDRFTLHELAQDIGRTPLETQALLARLVEVEKMDLVYHRASGDYLHRNRIGAGSRSVSNCPDCCASFPPEIVLESEVVVCQYCGQPL